MVKTTPGIQHPVPNTQHLLKIFTNNLFTKNNYLSEKSLFCSHQLKSVHIQPVILNNNNESWMFSVLIFCFILFAVIRFFFNKRLKLIYKSFMSNRFINQLDRESNLFNKRISIPLLINYFFIFPLFIYQINYLLLKIPAKSYYGFLFYTKIVFVIFVIYFAKNLLIRFIGNIFKTYKETSEYNLTLLIFNKISGLLLLPLLLIIIYSSQNIKILSLYFSIFLMCLIYLYRIVRLIIIGLSYSKFSKSYLFLYICTLEILPIIIIIKVLIISFLQ